MSQILTLNKRIPHHLRGQRTLSHAVGPFISPGISPVISQATRLFSHLRGQSMRRSLSLLLIISCLCSATADAKSGDETQPIDVSADRSEYDDKARVQRLIGNVEIVQGTMKISAEEIAIYLNDANELARIEGNGTPIRFEQLNDLNETIVGTANGIDYNALDGTLILSGNASLKQPRQELNSNQIVFNSRAQTVKADGGDNGRVSIRIQPPEDNR